MTPALHVTMTTDRYGAPLAVIDGPPFNGAELRPGELRRLAAALLRVADDAEKRKTTHRGRPLPPERRTYPPAPEVLPVFDKS